MRQFDLLIFDWDGTLADSAAHIVSTMQDAIAALNLPMRRDEQIRDLIGLGMSDVLHRLFPELDQAGLAALLDGYRQRFFSAHAYEAPLFEGAQEALQQLFEQGHLLSVATGKSRRGLNRSLQAHDALNRLLVASRTADETAPKPDPLMLRELLFEFDIEPRRALMIGDTEYDAQMARAIGVPMVGVTCGVHGAERLLDGGAQAVIDDVARLPAWLDSLAV